MTDKTTKHSNADLFLEEEKKLAKPKTNQGPVDGYDDIIANPNLQKAKKKKVKSGSFEAFNLSSEVFKAIKKKGYNLPTPIQRKVIPTILEGINVIAMARTGSGKTAAFVIPIIEKLKQHSKIVGARCLILSPTREIALQTASYFYALARFTDLTYVLITGGNDMENQFERLVLNPDVIIATPGRLMHCIKETGLQLNAVEIVVYDEADRLFEMGFAEQIKALTDKMPKNRQSLLFSATISSQVRDFALSGIKDYKMLQVDKESKLSDDLKLQFFVVRSSEKVGTLMFIMKELISNGEQTIIFAATRHHVEYLHQMCIHGGFKTTYIFGAMDQKSRDERLQTFRAKKVNFLIVTDLAARGIDIPLLDNVIHFDFPPQMKLFIHRSGRTARNGQKGTSYSLITKEELPYLYDLSIFVGRKYFDKETENENIEEILNNPTHICYGSIPQSTLDEYTMVTNSLHDKYPTILEPLQKSMQLSLLKYNKNRDPASKIGVSAVREIQQNQPSIHLLLVGKVDKIEEELNKFKESLKNYKPKQSLLELGIMKTLDQEKISKFQSALSQQNEKYQQKIERKECVKEYQKKFEEEQKKHDEIVIEMINQDKQIDQKLKRKSSNEIILEKNNQKSLLGKMSKKRRLKMQKILDDQTLDEKEKKALVENIEQDGLQKKPKRSQLQDFKDPKAYLSTERNFDTSDGKVNHSTLWGEEEKSFLEDLTLNLVPDDEVALDIRGKTVMRWDSKKKRHVLVKVDRNGKVIKEKRNEAGVKITNKNALKKEQDQKVYKKWMKKTHLKLQNVGEVEDSKALQVAKSSTESRSMMKQFQKKHKGVINRGEDARNNDHLIKMKRKKMMDKMKKGSKGKRDSKYGEKSWNKIVKQSTPTRTKLIQKKR